MQSSVTFKGFNSSEDLKSYVQDKLDRFDKFFDNPVITTVVLSVEKFRHIAEINITGDRLNINGREETDNMYSAIDMVLDKLEKQIKKNRQKARKRRSGSRTMEKGIIAEDISASGKEAAWRIKVTNIEYKPMDIEEAIMQIDLINGNFLVFTNAQTDQVNILYHRKDGYYGLIQPAVDSFVKGRQVL